MDDAKTAPVQTTWTFRGTLLALGFESYRDYLRSEHWRTFKASYHSANPKAQCENCGKRPVDLHHHDYRRLGREYLDDITPLCRTCHSELHTILKEAKRSVAYTKWALRKLEGCLWIKKQLTREEREEQDATWRVKELSSLRSAYGKFYASLRGKDLGKPPKAVLKQQRRGKGGTRRKHVER